MSILLVEQNATLALHLADHACVLETGRAWSPAAAEIRDDESVRRSYLGLLSGMRMQGLLHQLLSGIAVGGIYAILALALVVIYQATHHVNFAQGEMATFSTYIAWH